uniref:Uncharacterized protein n=1 Tax=Anguilla anguilla TaxID=7936 RepID=A0A0E9XMN9_ANGAN
MASSYAIANKATTFYYPPPLKISSHPVEKKRLI